MLEDITAVEPRPLAYVNYARAHTAGECYHCQLFEQNY
jgi:hypothetical protein